MDDSVITVMLYNLNHSQWERFNYITMRIMIYIYIKTVEKEIKLI